MGDVRGGLLVNGDDKTDEMEVRLLGVFNEDVERSISHITLTPRYGDFLTF